MCNLFLKLFHILLKIACFKSSQNWLYQVFTYFWYSTITSCSSFFCFCKSFFVVVVWTMANYSFKWNDGTSCRRTSFQWIQYSPLFSSDNNEHTAEKECCRGCDQGCRLAFFNIQKISNFAEEIFVPIVSLTVSILLCKNR